MTLAVHWSLVERSYTLHWTLSLGHFIAKLTATSTLYTCTSVHLYISVLMYKALEHQCTNALYTVQCTTVLYTAVQCIHALHTAVQCTSELYAAVQCTSVLYTAAHSTSALYTAVQCASALHTAVHCTLYKCLLINRIYPRICFGPAILSIMQLAPLLGESHCGIATIRLHRIESNDRQERVILLLVQPDITDPIISIYLT